VKQRWRSPSIGGVPPTKPDGYTKKSKGLVGGSAGSQGPDGWASVPRATLGVGTGSGLWRKRHGQHQAAKTTRQQNEAKQKQKPKATSE